MCKNFCNIVIIILLFVTQANTQNLVLNPSFENLTIDCCDYPLGTNPYLMLQYWTDANNVTGGSMCDLNHRCLSCVVSGYSLPQSAIYGNQDPRTGDGFSSHYAFAVLDTTIYSIDYVQGQLSNSLSAGSHYKISVWLSLADEVNYTFSNYGVLFTQTQLSENQVGLYNYSPQIVFNSFITETEGWQNFKFEFTATGNEEYITFGNFFEPQFVDSLKIGCADYDSLHPNSCYDICYVYLDDIAIYPADAPVYAADAGGDQLLCKGESSTLGSQSRSQYLYWWYDEQGNLIDTTAQIIVSPDSTTFYVLRQKDFKFDETSDTVVVYVSDCENPLYIPTIFSPNADGNNDVFRVRGEGISEIKTFLIYNRWGEEVFKCHTERSRSAALEDCGWDGTYRGEPASQAVYTYYVEAVLLNGKTVLKRGNVTLVR